MKKMITMKGFTWKEGRTDKQVAIGYDKNSDILLIRASTSGNPEIVGKLHLSPHAASVLRDLLNKGLYSVLKDGGFDMKDHE